MLMYEAKAERASHIHLVRARIVDGSDTSTIAEDEARPRPATDTDKARLVGWRSF